VRLAFGLPLVRLIFFVTIAAAPIATKSSALRS
jgi:hypothetical protein